MGGVAALVGLAHDGTLDARSLAAVVLRDLGSNDEHRASMARAGAIPPMVALLREQPDHWHAEAAVAVLWNCGSPSAPPVVGFGENAMTIVRPGAPPPLLALARGDGGAAGGAAEALRDLAAENAEFSAAVVAAGGGQILLAADVDNNDGDARMAE